MEITFDEGRKLFHLRTSEISYAMGITPAGKLLHLYWGQALPSDACFDELVETNLTPFTASGGVDLKTPRSYEFPTREPYDFSEPALLVTHADGVRSTRLVYTSHTIEKDCLSIVQRDEVYPLEVELQYKAYGDLPLISRRSIVRNRGTAPITLHAAMSACWNLPHGIDYRLTHFAGNWGAEYGRNRVALTQARTVLQNSRITSGACQQTPFFAIDPRGESTETQGEVFYGVLHWSGDFKITVEVEYGKRAHVTGGVNDYDAELRLAPGEAFETPLFTAGFSSRGFERMSEAFYDWQFDYLCPRGEKTDKAHAVRPIIYNSWYPYEFNVNEKNLLGLIDKAADIGAELFVIDDGWMPGRMDTFAGLGDWVADPKRFPRGMKPIVEACHQKGLLFGIWVEPEMVNPNSDLYRAHPDWVIHDPTRSRTEQRNQLVLNIARDEICDWIIGWLDRLIEDFQLDYMKWDMNRYITETGWPDAPADERRSLAIRYTKNLMRIWRHLNERHPDLLLENCAHGGGRSDFGMVPYADRINRSDNADPVDVMIIHEGFSTLFIPKTAGGAGNIAPEAHHIHKRKTPLPFRIHTGMTGSMSIGIDLLKADEDTLEALRKATADFKPIRADLQNAYVYRIASAYEHPYALFQYVRRDRKAFTLFAFAHSMRNWDKPLPRFRMRGLIPDAIYQDEQGRKLRGDALMNIGIQLAMMGDFDSQMITWRQV